jgi:hypothetical protein
MLEFHRRSAEPFLKRLAQCAMTLPAEVAHQLSVEPDQPVQ